MERERARNIAAVMSALGACAALLGWALWSGRNSGTEDLKIVSVAVGKSGKWLAAGTAAGRVAIWTLGGVPTLV